MLLKFTLKLPSGLTTLMECPDDSQWTVQGKTEPVRAADVEVGQRIRVRALCQRGTFFEVEHKE